MFLTFGYRSTAPLLVARWHMIALPSARTKSPSCKTGETECRGDSTSTDLTSYEIFSVSRVISTDLMMRISPFLILC